MLPGIEHYLAEIGAHETLPPGGDGLVLRFVGTHHNFDNDGSQGANSYATGESQFGPGGASRPLFDPNVRPNVPGQLAGLYLADSPPNSSASVGQGANAEAISRRASSADDSEGGFAELDGSDAVGKTLSRSAADGRIDAIDAVLAELYDFDASTKGETSGDAIEQSSADIAAGDPAASFDDAAAMSGGADQGGMVLLRSPEIGHNLVAASAEQPVDLSVPEANVHMEAAVGIYQAFDVATGEQPLAGKTIPAAAVVPTKKAQQNAKGSVSADKVAKPTMDQASAWVEIVTAAAVIGASKKERKSRTKS